MSKEQHWIRRYSDFLWSKVQVVSPVRRRHNDPTPDIKLICREEIVEAMKQVLTDQGPTEKNELAVRIARLLGFGSVRKAVAQDIGKVVSGAIKKGQVITKQDDGRVGLVESGALGEALRPDRSR